MKTLWGRYYHYPHLTDEETKVLRSLASQSPDQVTWLQNGSL